MIKIKGGAAFGRSPLYGYGNVLCLCIKRLTGFTSCAFALAFGGGAHYCYLDAIPGSRVGVGRGAVGVGATCARGSGNEASQEGGRGGGAAGLDEAPNTKTRNRNIFSFEPGREGGPDPYGQLQKKTIKKRSLTTMVVTMVNQP